MARRGAVRRLLGVSLKPDRKRADTTASAEAGETGGQIKLDGYYLSMEIDLERGQFSRLRSIGRGLRLNAAPLGSRAPRFQIDQRPVV